MNRTRLIWILIAVAIAVPATIALYVAWTDSGYDDLGAEDTNIVLRYVSTRAPSDSDKPAEAFGGDRGPTTVGHCRVASKVIPLGEVIADKANFFVPTRDRHITDVDMQDPAEFWRDVEETMAAGSAEKIVLFVHGYYYGFERVCLRGAGLQQMLDGRAELLMFTWPSDGNPAGYVADQADMEWSVPQLAATLRDIRDRFGPDRFVVVAHSLGTRGTLFALEQLLVEGVTGPVASQLILVAPDFDAEGFQQRLPDIAPLVGNITVYASDNDNPLKVSEGLHGHPRLGQAGEDLTVAEGFETVDVSPLGRYQYSGHEYFHFHPISSADLARLILTGAPAAERPHTSAKQKNGLTYWALDDTR